MGKMMPTRLLDATDLAEILGLNGRRAIYDRIYRGGELPPPLRLSRTLRWHPDDVADWLAEKRSEAAEEQVQRQRHQEAAAKIAPSTTASPDRPRRKPS